MTKDQIIEEVAGKFLSEADPMVGYRNLEKAKNADDYASNHVTPWQPFEYETVGGLLEKINDEISSVEQSYKRIEAEKRNLAEATAVVAYWVGYNKWKLGNEGIMLNYDLCVQMAEAFCEKYPAGYDWGEHSGDDWDVECEKFAQQYMKDNDIHHDPNY